MQHIVTQCFRHAWATRKHPSEAAACYCAAMRSALPAMLSLLVPLFAVGCGNEVGRISFSTPGNATTTATLDNSKDVEFWTELDVEWEHDVVLTYHIELEQESKQVARAVCNPLDVSTTLMSVTTDVGSKHTRSYTGKMRCSTTVPASGATHVKASFTAVPPPTKLAKFDLVIKQ